VIANTYPDEIEKKLGWMEICGSLGLILGPLLGGLLYQINGYTTTFILLTVVLVILSVITFLVLPPPKEEKAKEKRRLSLLKLAFNKKVFPTLVVVMFAMAGPAYLDPVLAPHLESGYGLSKLMIGVMFALPFLGYTSAVKGQTMLPKKFDRRIVLLIGLFIEGVAFFFIGPSFGMPNELYLVIIGLSLIGLGSAWAYLPSLPYMIDAAAKDMKIDDREHLSDCMSTVMGTAHYCGEALGPICAGLLTEWLHFSDGVAVFAGAALFYAFVYGFFTKTIIKLFRCKFTRKIKDENVELKQHLVDKENSN